MSATQTIEAGELSPNLVPTFSDSSASMVVAKVMALEPSHSNRPNMETGLVALTVIQVIHSEILRQNESFSTPFERFSDPQVRLRNRFNAWNSLSGPGRFSFARRKGGTPLENLRQFGRCAGTLSQRSASRGCLGVLSDGRCAPGKASGPPANVGSRS